MKTVKMFLYGTLKKGGFFFNRYNLDLHVIRIDKATLPGFRLMRGAYPWVDMSPDEEVHGEVHEYPMTMLDMFDMIEGHPYLYKRKEIHVDVNGAKQVAWVYLPEDEAIMEDSEQVEGNDYDVSS